MTTQTYEIEAWLGDDHGLTREQVEQLRQAADEITARYCTPDPDVDDPEEVRADLLAATAEERDAALTAAYRVLSGDTAVVDELAAELARVRAADARVKAALAQAARMTIRPGTRGTDSESAFARRVGVNRLTVRDWVDKQ